MLSFMLLQRQKNSFKADAEQFRKIKQMEESVQELEQSGKFIYQENYKRHILKKQVRFPRSSSEIPDSAKVFLAEVGKEINLLIKKNLNSLKQDNIKYLIIIEGMASADRAERSYNYRLSYERAFALYEFWQTEAGIVFDTENSEVLISGSGTGGVGREIIEENNQRFLIQIIPKVNAK